MAKRRGTKKTSKKRASTRRPAAKKTAARGKKTSTRKTAGDAAGANASGLSTDELERELRQRRRKVPSLLAKREKLLAQAAEITREIESLGGNAGGGVTGRRRPRNAQTLPDALFGVLKGREMGVSEVARAVQAAGYNTTAANFTTIVNQTLTRDKRFKRISRGIYTTK